MADNPRAGAAPALPRAGSPIPLWRHGDFMKLWTAQTISVFGDQFTGLAIPLIAALTLGATAGQMGILTAVERAPFLLIGLFAGVWVDRLPRRPILIVSDLGRAVVLLTIPLAAALGRLTLVHLYIVGAVVGILTLSFDVAYQANLPALVDRRQLVEGNSKLEATRSLASLAGPGIAGVVIQALTAPVAIVLDAASFVASGGLISFIEGREPVSGRPVRTAVMTDVREGLRTVFGNPLLRSVAACTATSNFFSSALFALYILFATRELGLGPAQLGLIGSLGNASGLLGALSAGRLAAKFGVGRVIVAAAWIGGLGQIPIVFATPQTALPLLVVAGLFGSFGVPVYNINQVSLRQAITPHRLQGRMNATMRFVVWGTMPLGALVGGALGEFLGLRSAIVIAAGGGLLAFLWIAFSPMLALKTIPEPVE